MSPIFQKNDSRMELFFEAVLFGKCTVLIRLRRKGEIFTFALEDHPSIKPFSQGFHGRSSPFKQCSWRCRFWEEPFHLIDKRWKLRLPVGKGFEGPCETETLKLSMK